MDTLSKERRSWNMSRITSRDTTPEKMVRSMIHRMGFRFSLHSSKLPGKPDILLPKYRSVILVHGCFWHRHVDCPFAYSPKSNASFWKKKFLANVARDKVVKRELRRLGWKLIVVWECELRRPMRLAVRLNRKLIRQCFR